MPFSSDLRLWQMLKYLQSHAHYELVLWWPLVPDEVDMGRFSWQITASEAEGGQSILFPS